MLTRVLYLFIYLVNYISPSRPTKSLVYKFSGAYYKTLQDFAHILPNFPSLFSKMSFSIQWSGFLANPLNFQPHSRGTSQNAGLATDHYLKILINFLGSTFIKPGITSTSTQNINPILGRLHRTLLIPTTFLNIKSVPWT